MLLIDFEKEKVYILSETKNYTDVYQNFGGYYLKYHEQYEFKGYNVTTKTYRLETEIF